MIWTSHGINLKFFTEAYFELEEDNEPNQKHAKFVADDTTDHPHVE